MPSIKTNGQPVRYTAMKGRRIERRGETCHPEELLKRLRRLHPDWVITFHVGDLKEKE